MLCGILGCLCYGSGDWLMIYGNTVYSGKLFWLTDGVAQIPAWRNSLAMVLAFPGIIFYGIALFYLEKSAEEVLGEDIKKVSKTELVATLAYGNQNDKDNSIHYRILKTTFYEGDQVKIIGLHTEALKVLFPVDSMDSCEELMIQDWPGALYKKDDTAFLCWTYSPEITYVLEYTLSKIDDSEIIKMAESAEPVDGKN